MRRSTSSAVILPAASMFRISRRCSFMIALLMISRAGALMKLLLGTFCNALVCLLLKHAYLNLSFSVLNVDVCAAESGKKLPADFDHAPWIHMRHQVADHNEGQ